VRTYPSEKGEKEGKNQQKKTIVKKIRNKRVVFREKHKGWKTPVKHWGEGGPSKGFRHRT